MALKAIDLLVRNLRQKGDMDDLLDEQKTSSLLTVLERHLKVTDSPCKTALLSIELSLSTLESGSITPGRIQAAWTPKRLARLAAVLPALLKLESSNADRLGVLSLRLMLNLTNSNAKACSHFATGDLVHVIAASINERFVFLRQMQGSEVDELAVVMDRVILSLGAVINLAEFCDLARTTMISPDTILLDSLVRVFLEHNECAAEAESVVASQLNVAYGWLSVMLGNLCLNPQVKARVAWKLPGDTLRGLVDAIEEFVLYHRKADREVFEGEEGDAVAAAMTERLKALVTKLKEEDQV